MNDMGNRYYIPSYANSGEEGFGIKEISQEYFQDHNPKNFSSYAGEFTRICKTFDFEQNWHVIQEAIKSKNGKLVEVSELAPKIPERIFEETSEIIWYLNNVNELVYRNIYNSFQIIAVFHIKKDTSFRITSRRRWKCKTFLKIDGEKEFLRELEEWIEKNKLRFELK